MRKQGHAHHTTVSTKGHPTRAPRARPDVPIDYGRAAQSWPPRPLPARSLAPENLTPAIHDNKTRGPLEEAPKT
jgi:hypothetical protein